MLDKERKNFHHFGLKQGLSSIILSMVEDRKGNMWFGSQEHGLIKYDFKSFAKYGYYEGLTYVTVSDLKLDQDGHIWMSMWTGVSEFDGTNFHHLTGYLQGYASRLAIDKNNNIWFGGLPGGFIKLTKPENLFLPFHNLKGCQTPKLGQQ